MGNGLVDAMLDRLKADAAAPTTFVKGDGGKVPLNLIPRAALEAMGRAFGYGAKKYAPGNWLLCREPGRYVAATMRHLVAWNDGEENDAESGLGHLDHAAASLAMLIGIVEDMRRRASGPQDPQEQTRK